MHFPSSSQRWGTGAVLTMRKRRPTSSPAAFCAIFEGVWEISSQQHPYQGSLLCLQISSCIFPVLFSSCTPYENTPDLLAHKAFVFLGVCCEVPLFS